LLTLYNFNMTKKKTKYTKLNGKISDIYKNCTSFKP
jgi:hypothetical protein